MKLKIVLALFVFMAMVLAGQAQAAEKDGFWSSLQEKVQKLKPSKKPDVITAVGGVRGFKENSEEDIYWKGKEKPDSVTEEELEKFNQALDAKIQGNHEKSLKGFEAFLNDYPQSSLRVDALQAVEKIKADMEKPKAAVKAAKKNSSKTATEQ